MGQHNAMSQMGYPSQSPGQQPSPAAASQATSSLINLPTSGPDVFNGISGGGGSGGDRQQQLRRAHGRLPPCSALALSGVPAREQLFNGSLCDGAGHFHDLLHNPNHIGADRGREERARGRKARGHLEVRARIVLWSLRTY